MSASSDCTVRLWEGQPPDPEDDDELEAEQVPAEPAREAAKHERPTAEAEPGRKSRDWVDRILAGYKRGQARRAKRWQSNLFGDVPSEAPKKTIIKRDNKRRTYKEELAIERALERQRKERREELIRQGKIKPPRRRPRKKKVSGAE